MKTAMMSSSPTIGGGNTGSAAIETAVDAYATRVLQESTPAETFFDTSLGPYVASVLRCTEIQSQPTDLDVTSLAEFDSLLELLEDQCNMERDAATNALKTIAEAVVTGAVPHQESSSPPKHCRGAGGAGLYSMNAGSSLDSFQSMKSNFPYLQTQKLEQLSIDPYTPNSAGGPSPLKPDNLIPVDLLGFLDDPSAHQLQHRQKQEMLQHYQEQEHRPMGTIAAAAGAGNAFSPSSYLQEEYITASTSEDAFPPLGSSATNGSSKHSSAKKSRGRTKGASKGKNSDRDLAAALFRPSRPRQNSIEKEESSPPLSSMSHPTGAVSDPQHSHGHSQYFQQQVESCVEILLSMNTDIGEAAAKEAAVMSNADFNIAQYIVDKALSAPPVCRHILHDGCYRSDCQFSHDVEGHTCLFWLRGRCTKPVSVCKFLHGFHPKMMEGLPTMTAPPATEAMRGGYAHPYGPPGFGGFSLPPSGNPVMRSWQQQLPSLADSSASTYSSSAGSTSNGGSFANIALRGYDKHQYASPQPPVAAESSTASSVPIPTVRIPQNLWNAHENRDASVFYIADPVERYRQVCAASGHQREDVIDLHFQSTKTFTTVLEQILPSKLHSASAPDGGIWVVTGTGHHVGSKTHQKGGGALERAVMQWLQEQGYDFARGKDRNGLGGALLVKR